MDDVVAKATVQIVPDLKGFTEKMKADLDQAMGGKDVTVPIKADGSEAEVEMDKVGLKADELGAKDVTVKIRTDGETQAEEKLKTFGDDLEHVGKQADGASEHIANTNKGLNTLGAGAGSAGEQMGGILMPAILTLGPALVPIAGVATGAGIAFAGMGTAALAGVGAFAVAAIPVFKEVSTAMQKISADQAAITNATTDAGKTTAIAHLTQDIKNLNPETATLLAELDHIKFAFKAWDEQFKPEIMEVFNHALAIAVPLMNDMTPLVHAGAKALDQMFGSIKTAVEAPDFKQFIGWLAQEAPAALMTFITFFESFAAGFSKMMEGMTPFMHSIESGLMNLGASFEKFASSNRFKEFVDYVVQAGPAVGQFFQQFFLLIERLLTGLAPMGGVVLVVVTDFLKLTNAVLQLLGPFSGVALFAIGAVLSFALMGTAAKMLEEGVIHLWTRLGTLVGMMKDFVVEAYLQIAVLGEWALAMLGVETESILLNAVMGATLIGAAILLGLAIYELVKHFGAVKGVMIAAAGGIVILGAAMMIFDVNPVVLAISAVVLGLALLVTGVIFVTKHFGVLPAIMAVAAAAVLGLAAAFVILDAVPVVALVVGIALALAGLVAGVIYVATHWKQVWGEVKSIFGDVVGFLHSGLGTLALVILGPVGAIIFLALHWKQVWGGVMAVFHAVYGFVASHVTLIVGALMLLGGPLFWVIGVVTLVATHWSTVWHGVMSVFSAVYDFIKSHVTMIVGALMLFGGPLFWIIGVVTLVATHWNTVWHGVMSVFSAVYNFVKSHVTMIVGVLMLIGGPLFWLIGVVVLVATHWDTVWAAMKSVVSIAWNGIQTAFQAIADGARWLWGEVNSAIGSVIGFFESIPGRIGALFSSAGSWLLQAGKDIVGGLIHGIVNAPLDAIKDIGKHVIGAFRTALSWFSPPAWSLQAGGDIMGGLTKGIADNKHLPANELSTLKLTEALAPELKKLHDAMNGTGKDLKDLVSALSGLQHLNGASADLKPMLESLKQLGKVVDEITRLKLDGVDDKIKELTTILGDLGSAFKKFGSTGGSAGKIDPAAMQGIVDSLETVKAKLPWIVAGLNGLETSMGGASHPVDTLAWIEKSIGELGKGFDKLRTTASSAGKVTPDSLQGIVNSLEAIKERMPYIVAGMNGLSSSMSKSKSPVDTLQWIKEFIGTLGKSFDKIRTTASSAGKVTVASMQGIVDSLEAIKERMPYIVAGANGLSNSMSKSKSPVDTLEWVDKFIGELGKSFDKIRTTAGSAGKITIISLMGIVDSLQNLKVAMPYVVAGVNGLSDSLSKSKSPVDTLKWAEKIIGEIGHEMDKIVSTAGSSGKATPGTFQSIVNAVASLATGMAYIVAGLDNTSDALSKSKSPVDTLKWAEKVFDTLTALWPKVAAASAGAGAASGGLGGITSAIKNITSALGALPSSITSSSSSALSSLNTSVGSMQNLLSGFTTSWKSSWNELPGSVASAWSKIQATLTTLTTTGLTPLKNAGQGLTNGLVSQFKALATSLPQNLGGAQFQTLNAAMNPLVGSTASLANNFRMIQATTAPLVAVLKSVEGQARSLAPSLATLEKSIANGSALVAQGAASYKSLGKILVEIVPNLTKLAGGAKDISTALKLSAESVQAMLSGFLLMRQELGQMNQVTLTFSTTWRTQITQMMSQFQTFSQAVLIQVISIQTGVNAMATVWSASWKLMQTSINGFASALQTQVGSIKGNGLTPLQTAIGQLSSAWGTAFTQMGGAVQAMWTQVAPILSGLQTALQHVQDAAAHAVVLPPVVPGPVKAAALGGTLLPNEWSWVGEQGPELMWTGAQPATVLPNSTVNHLLGSAAPGNASGGAGSASNVTIQTQFQPSVVIHGSGLTPAQLEQTINRSMETTLTNLQAMILAHGGGNR